MRLGGATGAPPASRSRHHDRSRPAPPYVHPNSSRARNHIQRAQAHDRRRPRHHPVLRNGWWRGLRLTIRDSTSTPLARLLHRKRARTSGLGASELRRALVSRRAFKHAKRECGRTPVLAGIARAYRGRGSGVLVEFLNVSRRPLHRPLRSTGRWRGLRRSCAWSRSMCWRARSARLMPA